MKSQICHPLRCLNLMIKRNIENSPHIKVAISVTGANNYIINYLIDHKEDIIFQKDIEEIFQLSKSTASKMLTTMEENGLIERMQMKEDARLKRIIPTQKSVLMEKGIEEDMRAIEEQLFTGFSEEDKSKLLKYIAKLRENMNDNHKEEDVI